MDNASSIDFDAVVSETPASSAASSSQQSFREVLQDYCGGFMDWTIWLNMALTDIRCRYRRTVIGPFWTTLSLAIFIVSMGVLFSYLWKTDIKTFLPYFSSGFICWTFFSSFINEGCTTFSAAEGLMKQIPLPYSVYAWGLIARSFIVFLHQVVIFIAIAFIFHVPVTRYTWLVIPGFLLLFISGSWITILCGLACARFRDFQQVVISLLQISMFVTPIFWPTTQLGHGIKAYLLVNGNPLYHYVAVIRYPLLGQAPSAISWTVVGVLSLLGWLFTMGILAKYYRKLIFWL